MTFKCLGKVAVPTPGTPVALSTDATEVAHYIVVSQVPAMAGVVYLKNIKTGTAVIVRAFVPSSTSGFIDEHRIKGADLANPLHPADWAIDAANATEGLNVYWAVV